MFRLQSESSPKTAKRRVQTKQFVRTVLRIAAVFAISFLLGILSNRLWEEKQAGEITYIENIVPLGSKSEIKLPDGSIVWLNAGSALRYPSNYGVSSRDVYLVGEGYFKVAKQTKNLFTVHTSLMKVKALGTEFNVKAYLEEGKTETTLINGKVMIDYADESVFTETPVVLQPGERFSMRAASDSKTGQAEWPKDKPAVREEIQPQPKVEQLSSAVIYAEVSWKERNWRIESERLQDLAVKLDRRYDVRIHMDEQLKNYRFTGTIKDESLEQVLYAMQLTAPILFRVEGKTVFIRIDPKKMK